MSEPLLSCIEQNPDSAPAASVIWMHGLGASGDDFAPVPPYLGLPSDLAVRFVFPHAPSIPVTLNGGMVMPAWYDIASLDTRRQDEAGVRRSAERVRALIERERGLGIPAERIVLAGFSQGAAMALFTGLRYPDRLAGIMALSGYMVLAESLAAEASAANRGTPIFQAHGASDPMLPIAFGRASRATLEEAGYSVEWKEYPMAHEVCPEELRDIGRWLSRVLASGAAGDPPPPTSTG